ncbi:tripartite tricarboxylate transporter permease [Shumkonia mesophila]|uniref:tripartite tricarboxylate transporter permease n=1 Tax=Shumkonia mesophila TaxID=2838854 RepID=UPI00293493F9|nr:tripartite tricarboxylate transporter permease [Shumkonia mesophila]
MDAVLLGFETLMRPEVLAFLFIGVVAGLTVGAIPGLNDNIAFAIFIPFSFSMPPTFALALMVGLYCSTAVGGSIPAIMVKVPGTASAIITTIDGNAMARQGAPGKAIGIAITSSVVGGLSSAIVLVFLAPPLAKFALRFGYVENFALGVLGLASVVGLLGGNVFKGLISAALGLLVATVGLSQETGFPRFTFGIANLYEGVPFLPLLVGLFGITAVFELTEELVRERRAGRKPEALPRISDRLILPSALVRRLIPTWVRCSIIGNVIGVIPGAGMLMAIFLGYERTSRVYKRKYEGRPGEAKWGEGAPEGIAAPEAANNAVVASSMVPLLSLGIPGNSVSALFIAALMIHGMMPGPLLFIEHADIAWMIILAFVAGNLVMGPIAFGLVKTLTGMVYRLSKELLIPTIALLCLSGAYSDENAIFSIWVALIAGLVGYALRKLSIPHAPIILALVLGRQIEDNFANSLIVSKGNWSIFIDPVNHPISLLLIAGATFFMLGPVFGFIRTWARKRWAARAAASRAVS